MYECRMNTKCNAPTHVYICVASYTCSAEQADQGPSYRDAHYSDSRGHDRGIEPLEHCGELGNDIGELSGEIHSFFSV